MKVAFQLGEATVYGQLHQVNGSKLTMVNVHDDENTSVEAGLNNVNRLGGRVIELVHSGDRLVKFNLNGQTYLFDPNRVFSDAGITATLKKHSQYSADALVAIKTFARQYVDHFALEKEPVIVALHNTSDGTFSIKTYAPGGALEAEAIETHVSPNWDKFDFCFVTDKRFFDYLKNRDVNVALQDNRNATDDGSLSVYFSKRGIPYINIEAEIKNLEPQIRLVNIIREMLKEFNLD